MPSAQKIEGRCRARLLSGRLWHRVPTNPNRSETHACGLQTLRRAACGRNTGLECNSTKSRRQPSLGPNSSSPRVLAHRHRTPTAPCSLRNCGNSPVRKRQNPAPANAFPPNLPGNPVRHSAPNSSPIHYFLIDSALRLEIAATHTKQRTGHVSNR
jgi:hypothetical protein